MPIQGDMRPDMMMSCCKPRCTHRITVIPSPILSGLYLRDWGGRGPGFKIGTRHHDFSPSSFIYPSLSSHRKACRNWIELNWIELNWRINIVIFNFGLINHITLVCCLTYLPYLIWNWHCFPPQSNPGPLTPQSRAHPCRATPVMLPRQWFHTFIGPGLMT